MRRRLQHATLALAATLSLVGWPAPASASEPAGTEERRHQRLARALNDPAWMVDERQRVYRVSFPRHDRLVLGVGAVSGASQPARVAQHVEVGFKSTLGLDFDQENIWWRFRHTFFDVDYTFGDGWGRLEPTVLRADYLRHDDSSFVVIPMERDIKLPAPFDIAVDYELGHFDLRHERGDWTLERIDVADVAILLDFIRDPDYRHRLAVGPSGAYRALRGDEAFVHELAPMSGLELLYANESHDGLYAVDLRGGCQAAVRLVADDQLRWRTHCGAEARAEVVVMSINDLPVSVPLHVEVDATPGHSGGRSAVSWTATAGVRLGLLETL